EDAPKLTKDSELKLMLEWLEVGNNFAAVYGKQKTPVGSKQESASRSWVRAAAHLSKETGLSLTAESAKARFKRYKDAYFEAAKFSNRIAAGVGEDDCAGRFVGTKVV
ncbi:hypothetical protein BGZ58_002787, partial [Dissophora ornata]